MLFLPKPKHPSFMPSSLTTVISVSQLALELVVLQLSLVVAYFGSFFYRTLARSEEVTTGEIAQGTVAVLVGFGGAIAVRNSAGLSGVAIGVVSLIMAAGCYAASFAFIDRRLERRTSFVFYTSLALLFTLVSFGELLDGPVLALALVDVLVPVLLPHHLLLAARLHVDLVQLDRGVVFQVDDAGDDGARGVVGFVEFDFDFAELAHGGRRG